MLTIGVALVFIVMAYALAKYLIVHDRGAKEPENALWEAFGFGIIASVIAIVLELVFVDREVMSNIRQQNVALGVLPPIALLIGAIEELAKFLPLAIFIRRRPYFNEVTDGVMYFALAGACFGMLENFVYLADIGPAAAFRIIMVFFFHAATAGIAGFYFARAHVKGESLLKTGVAVTAVILLHGFYDLGLFSGLNVLVMLSLVTTVLLNASLFLYYMRATEIDQELGIAAVGSNAYCRHCGLSNPTKTLYCEHCGHLA